MDETLFRTLYGGSTHGAIAYGLMVALTVLGSGWSMIAFVPFAVLRRTRRTGAFLLATLVATSLVVFGVKLAVGRARPCFALGGVKALCFAPPTDPSFPSGHAAGAFAFSAFLATLVLASSTPRRTKAFAVLALAAVATGIAISRVYLGVHFPTDVAAGAVLGTLLGHAGARIALRRAPRDAPAPTAAPETARTP